MKKGEIAHNRGPSLVGQQFNLLKVIAEEKRLNRMIQVCICDCGQETTVKRPDLLSGKKKSCGCLKTTIKNLSGKKFGQLVVIKYIYTINRIPYWVCECTCGNFPIKPGYGLKRAKDCGCLRKPHKTSLGSTYTHIDLKLKGVLRGIINRCYDLKNISYLNYGGRGITVCDEWKENFSSFRNWALENGYSPGLQIDRIDNNGNYCPENCRWATRTENLRNTRSNHLIKVDGVLMPVSQACEIYGMSNHYKAVINRITKLNWDITEALTTPIRKLSYE